MVRRRELTDQEWELLAPLIPRAATGRPRVEDRQVVNGMVYKLRTGISRRDPPERHGPWQTVHTRFRRYALDGVFTRALRQVQAQAGVTTAPAPASCSNESAFPAAASAGHAADPTRSSRTRPPASAVSAPTCAGAASPTPSRRSGTRSATAATGAATVAVRRLATPCSPSP
ncbi:transposase [Streptomyces macrosporus]|uniref:transposase n=1 Tax=Streptomyces macrosporus TaxID=44032 RepID=UPI003CD0AA2A